MRVKPFDGPAEPRTFGVDNFFGRNTNTDWNGWVRAKTTNLTQSERRKRKRLSFFEHASDSGDTIRESMALPSLLA